MSVSRAGARSYRKGRLVINLFPHNFKVDKTVGSYTLLIQIDSFWMPNRKPKTDYRSLTLKAVLFSRKKWEFELLCLYLFWIQLSYLFCFSFRCGMCFRFLHRFRRGACILSISIPISIAMSEAS